jgi:hypothetical protein
MSARGSDLMRVITNGAVPKKKRSLKILVATTIHIFISRYIDFLSWHVCPFSL